MQRGPLIQSVAGGALAAPVSARQLWAQAEVERARRGAPSPKIKDITVIATQVPHVGQDRCAG